MCFKVQRKLRQGTGEIGDHLVNFFLPLFLGTYVWITCVLPASPINNLLRKANSLLFIPQVGEGTSLCSVVPASVVELGRLRLEDEGLSFPGFDVLIPRGATCSAWGALRLCRALLPTSPTLVPPSPLSLVRRADLSSFKLSITVQRSPDSTTWCSGLWQRRGCCSLPQQPATLTLTLTCMKIAASSMEYSWDIHGHCIWLNKVGYLCSGSCFALSDKL